MNAKTIELEDKISKIIFKDNQRTVHFEYTYQEIETPYNALETAQQLYTKTKKFQVIAHTFNSQNHETFLLKTAIGDSYEECLQKIYDFINHTRISINSYTVDWGKKGSTKRELSYFTGASVIEVIEKFFAGKNPDEYYVFQIKMNPIS